MPTYEYACKSCGEHLDVVQAFTDDALTTCPDCGGQLRKVFGNIAIAFKGSGFYKTDNRSVGKGNSTAPATDSETKPAPAGDSTKGSESESGSAKVPASGSESTTSGNGSTTSGDKAGKSAKTDKSPAPS